MSFYRQITILGSVTLTLIALAFLYTFHINPEVVLWKLVSNEQEEWDKQLSGKRYVFTGGSSCVFSVNPVVFKEQFGLSVVNAGAAAGFGRPFHLDSANRFLRAGDTCVLNFETDFWAQEGEIDSLPLGTAAWFSYMRGKQEGELLSKAVLGENKYELQDARSGGEHFLLIGAKLIMGKGIYRYEAKDIHPGGYCTTLFQAEFSGSQIVTSPRLSSDRREFLVKLKKVLQEREISLMVNLPWKFVSDEVVEEERENIKALSQQIVQICPVIEDPYNGSRSDREIFADSGWHLTEESAEERSQIIGRFLTTFEKLER